MSGLATNCRRLAGAHLAALTGAWCLLCSGDGFAQDAPAPASAPGHVLDLDGTGSYVELPSNIFNDLTEATVEGWVKWSSFRAYSRFFDFGTTWKAIVVCNENNSPNLYFSLGRPPFNQGSELRMTAANMLVPKEWCHVAVVTGSRGAQLYFNGTKVASSTYAGSFSSINNGEHNYLGHSNWSKPPYDDKDLEGQMDEVRVWRTQRSEAEIRDNMFKELTGTEEGLVSLWKFEVSKNAEVNKNRIVVDSGPGNHHGKLVGNARIVSDVRPNEVRAPQLPGPDVLEPGAEFVLLVPDNQSAIQLPAGILDGLKEITFEGWVRWDDNVAWTSPIYFGHGNTGRDHKLCIFRMGAEATLRLNLDEKKADKWIGEVIDVAQIIRTGQWTHVAAVVGPKGASLYSNGVLVGTNANLKLSGLNGNPGNYLGQQGFVGRLDEVRLWRVSRTPDQIRQSFMTKLSGKEDGLVGLWNFDDPLAPGRDVTGHGFDGKIHGSARVSASQLPKSPPIQRHVKRPTWVPAQVIAPLGPSLTLAEKGSFVELPQALFPHTDRHTVEAWVKLNQITKLPQNVQRVFSYGKAGHEMQLGFSLRGSKPFFQVNEPKQDDRLKSMIDWRRRKLEDRLRSDEELKVGQWAHLAAVTGPSGMHLYLNGREVAGNEVTGVSEDMERNAGGRLGQMVAGGHDDSPFDGELAEVRVWDGERTAVEIYDNFQKKLTGNEPGLLALWNFDDGTMRDATPRRRDGTMVGNAKFKPAAAPQPAAAVPPKEEIVRNTGVLQLDGNGSYLELPPDILRGLREGTIEGWVRWDEFNGTPGFFSFGKDELRLGVMCTTSGNWPRAILSVPEVDEGSSLDLRPVTRLTGLRAGEWIHLAVVMGKDGMYVYANGSLIGCRARNVEKRQGELPRHGRGGKQGGLARSDRRGAGVEDGAHARSDPR